LRYGGVLRRCGLDGGGRASSSSCNAGGSGNTHGNIPLTGSTLFWLSLRDILRSWSNDTWGIAVSCRCSTINIGGAPRFFLLRGDPECRHGVILYGLVKFGVSHFLDRLPEQANRQWRRNACFRLRRAQRVSKSGADWSYPFGFRRGVDKPYAGSCLSYYAKAFLGAGDQDIQRNSADGVLCRARCGLNGRLALNCGRRRFCLSGELVNR
jgi:hypothetical protein